MKASVFFWIAAAIFGVLALVQLGNALALTGHGDGPLGMAQLEACLACVGLARR